MDQNENSPWQYKPDHQNKAQAQDNLPPEDNSQPDPPERSARSVSWEAPEFIEHPHGSGWYALLALSTIVLAGLVYLVSKDLIASIIIIIVGIIVGFFVRQKPAEAKYEITDAGLAINGKAYNYSDYKSFTVVREGSLSSVNLFPLKRLMPPISAYFDPKDEKKVVNALGNYLPYEERNLDSIDRLTRRLRL